MSSKRKLRSSGTTGDQTLDSTKTYKYNSSGTLVEATSIGNDDVVFSGSKSSLRRMADLERNVSILASKALTDDGSGSGTSGYVDYAKKAGQWYSSRTLSLTGAVTGSVSIDGSGNVSLATTATSDPVITLTGDVSGSGTMTNLGNVSIAATIQPNSVALGTDTTGNYMVNVTGSNGVSVSHTQGEGSTAALSLAGTYTGTWAVTGAITATGEVTAYASDARLKTNVVAIESPLAKVEAIRGVTYEWNELGQSLGLGTAPQVGVIAQEIEAVLPQLVVESAHEGYKTVKYDKLTALLIESVKELSAKVKTLEARLGDQSL